jgi:Flp pilus assembly protein TadG
MLRSKSRGAQHGAIFVEFVIVLPFLLVFLAGIIEFGLLFYNQQVLTNASREGARAGIAYATDISDIVDNYCQNRLISFGSSPTLSTVVTGTQAFGNNLQVTVSYDYIFVIPNLIPQILGLEPPSMTLEATTEMRMELPLGT